MKAARSQVGAGTDSREAGARLRAGHGLALVALVLLCWGNALDVPFTLDDFSSIVDNPALRPEGAWRAGSPTRWLTHLTFALNFQAGGLGVAGYHAFNVAVHALAALVLYALAAALLTAPGARTARGAAWVAFGAAALFAAHPIQTQAVTYVVQRAASMAGLLYVAALALYLAARRAAPGSGAARAYLASAIVAAALAMLTKEIAFTLPFAILGLEWGFGGEGQPPERRRRALLPFLAMVPVVPLLVARHLGTITAATGSAGDRVTLSRLEYLRAQAVVVAGYLRLLLLPAGQSIEHDVLPAGGFGGARVAASALLLAALLGGAALLFLRGRSRELRVAGFGGLLFFLALSVESTVIPIADVMVEHRLYLPSAGAALLLAGGAAEAIRRRPGAARPLAAGALAATLGLGAATHLRNEIWRDPVRLWTEAVERNPRSARAHFALGNALLDSGRLDLAEPQWEVAVAIDPLLGQVWNQLGNAAWLRGDLATAEARFHRALSGRIPFTPAWRNLGAVLDAMGRRAEAAEALRRFEEAGAPVPAEVRAPGRP